MPPANVRHHSLINAVAGHTHGFAHDDAIKRDHGRLGATPADVDDHVSARRANRDTRADRRRQRFRNKVSRLARPSLLGSVSNRPLLHARDAGRHSDHDLRPDDVEAPGNHADEIAQHRLRREVVSNDAITHWPDDADGTRCPALHGARFRANGNDSIVPVMSRHDRRLVDHDALAFDVDENVRRAQIDPGFFRSKEFKRH